jgi:hypothetical protein
VLMAEQPAHPLDVAEHWLRHELVVSHLRKCQLRAMRGVDDEMLHRVLGLVPPVWMLLQSDAQDLFVGVPPDADPDLVQTLDSEFRRIGLHPKGVTKGQRTCLFDLMRRDPPAVTTIMVSSEENLATPAKLNTRFFWLTRRRPVVPPRRREALEALVSLKSTYESSHGAGYPDEFRIGRAEIRRFLCDPTSIRGPQMLEILFDDAGTLSVSLRIKETTLRSTDEALANYIEELSQVMDQTFQILDRFEAAGDPLSRQDARLEEPSCAGRSCIPAD